MASIPILTVRRMYFALIGLGALLLLASVAPGFAQGNAPVGTPTIQRSPATYSNPTSGAEMFKSYCAACHGAKGKGDGPAAAALKMALPDLTQMSARNRGDFPEAKFVNMLEHGSVPAHGSVEMPIWGPVFDALNNESVTLLRISNLAAFVDSLQGE